MSNQTEPTLTRVRLAMNKARSAERDQKAAENQMDATLVGASTMIGQLGISLEVNLATRSVHVVLRLEGSSPYVLTEKEARGFAGWVAKHVGPGPTTKEAT